MFDKNKQITVAGDVMLDQYWFGDVKRISQEAPVPIVNITSEEFRPGGANVAINIANLGPKVNLFGVGGKDQKLKTLIKPSIWIILKSIFYNQMKLQLIN